AGDGLRSDLPPPFIRGVPRLPILRSNSDFRNDARTCLDRGRAWSARSATVGGGGRRFPSPRARGRSLAFLPARLGRARPRLRRTIRRPRLDGRRPVRPRPPRPLRTASPAQPTRLGSPLSPSPFPLGRGLRHRRDSRELTPTSN